MSPATHYLSPRRLGNATWGIRCLRKMPFWHSCTLNLKKKQKKHHMAANINVLFTPPLADIIILFHLARNQ